MLRLPRCCRGTSTKTTEQIGEFVPVLIACDSEKSQKGSHGRKAAAHCVTPVCGDEQQQLQT